MGTAASHCGHEVYVRGDLPELWRPKAGWRCAGHRYLESHAQVRWTFVSLYACSLCENISCDNIAGVFYLVPALNSAVVRPSSSASMI